MADAEAGVEVRQPLFHREDSLNPFSVLIYDLP
jgi:hypothetical protein